MIKFKAIFCICNFAILILKNRASFAETLAVIYVTLLALFGLEGGGGGGGEGGNCPRQF